MDTRDLKGLFDQLPTDTNLTSDSVLDYAEEKQQMRARISAVTVIVAIIAVFGASAMALQNVNNNPQPAVTASPEPEETTSEPVESSSAEETSNPSPSENDESTATETVAFPEQKCEVGIPEDWERLYAQAPKMSGNDQAVPYSADEYFEMIPGDEGVELNWIGTESEPIAIADNVSNLFGTDGRFVIFSYVDREGLYVWDYENPGEPQLLLEGNFNALESFDADIHNGQVFAYAEGSVYRLDAETAAQDMLVEGGSDKTVIMGEVFNDGIQVSVDGEWKLYNDQGEQTLPAGITDGQIIGSYFETYLVMGDDGSFSLQNEAWDERYEFDGAAHSMVGPWVLIDWEDGTSGAFNFETGVTIDLGPDHHFAAVDPQFLESWAEGEDPVGSRVDVEDLTEVACN